MYLLIMWHCTSLGHIEDIFTYLYLCTFRILICLEFTLQYCVDYNGLVCFNTQPSTSTCTACRWTYYAVTTILYGSNQCGLYSDNYRLFFNQGYSLLFEYWYNTALQCKSLSILQCWCWYCCSLIKIQAWIIHDNLFKDLSLRCIINWLDVDCLIFAVDLQ